MQRKQINLQQSSCIFPGSNPPTYLAEVPSASFSPALTSPVVSAPLKGKPFPGALDLIFHLRNSLQQVFPFSPTSSIALCLLDHSINVTHKLILSFLKHNKASFLDSGPSVSCHSMSVLPFTTKFLKRNCFSLPSLIYFYLFSIYFHETFNYSLPWKQPLPMQ